MSKTRCFLLIAGIAIAFPALVYAACKSDCREEYESARDDCVLLYDHPDEADDLQMCLQSAKDDYDECIAECNR